MVPHMPGSQRPIQEDDPDLLAIRTGYLRIAYARRIPSGPCLYWVMAYVYALVHTLIT
jgi:hypothetical protein